MNEQFKNSSETNPERVYNAEEAKQEVNERRDIIKKLVSKIIKTKQADLFGLLSYIDEKFFSHLNQGEKEKHISHHLLAGSSISPKDEKDMNYYFDKTDQEVESLVQELLSIEDKSEFIKRAKNIIDELKKNEL